MKMEKNKESVVNLMVAVYENTNKYMCLMSGMTEEDTEKRTIESRPAMQYFMSAIYDKLDENDLLKTE